MSKLAILFLLLQPTYAHDLLPVGDDPMFKTDPITWINYRQLVIDLDLWSVEDDGLSTSIGCELRWAQGAVQETEKYPPVASLYMFPSKEAVESYLEFSKSFQKTLRDRIEASGRDEAAWYNGILHLTHELREPWGALLLAHTRKASYMKRMQLGKLVDKIGGERYWSGNMPPHVPFSVFRPKDN